MAQGPRADGQTHGRTDGRADGRATDGRAEIREKCQNEKGVQRNYVQKDAFNSSPSFF